MIRIGVLGLGGRSSHLLAALKKMDPTVVLGAVYDAYADFARDKIVRNALHDDPQAVRIYADPQQMLRSEKLDGIIIGTRCSRHAELACLVAPTGVPLLLEKPVAVNLDQVRRLRDAFRGREDRVVVSFPLRTTELARRVREILDSGAIGSVEHVQYVNNVTYGAGYFKGWYRDVEETGGLWLQKATHDLDMINFIVAQPPRRIAAMHSQRVFGGRKPPGLLCRPCAEAEVCPESPSSEAARNDTLSDIADPNRIRACAFGVEIHITDNGSCLVEYASGMHAVYSQNFFIRRDGAFRGATIIGYRGTVDFDFHTLSGRLIYHHRPVTERFQAGSHEGHGGGDFELLRNFRDIILGREKSKTPLSAGVLSAYMCLKARQSAEEGSFLELNAETLS